MFRSKNDYFNKVKDFHAFMDGTTQETPKEYDEESAFHRASFKVEELVEFLHASCHSKTSFQKRVYELHQELDKAAEKVSRKRPNGIAMRDQVDALLDLLYFTYGSFVLMGVDPEPIFELVHQANMEKKFPDGKVHFDPISHKILKPVDWEERFAPEKAIELELQRQMKRLDR